jgi:hypothetical protein
LLQGEIEQPGDASPAAADEMNLLLRRRLPMGRIAMALAQALLLGALVVMLAPGRAGAANDAAGIYSLGARIPFPHGCTANSDLAGMDPVTGSVVTIAANPTPNKCPGLPDGTGVWLRETPAATLVPGPLIKLNLAYYANSAFDILAAMSIDAKSHSLFVFYAGQPPAGSSTCSANWIERYDLNAITHGAKQLDAAQVMAVPYYVDPTVDGSQSVSLDDPTAVIQTGEVCQDLAPYDLAYDPQTGSIDAVEAAVSPFTVSAHGSGLEDVYPMYDFHLDRSGSVKWGVQLGKCTQNLPTDHFNDVSRRTVMHVHLGTADLVAGGCMYTRAPSSGTGSGNGAATLPTVGSMLAWVIRIGADGTPSAPAYYLGRSNVQSVVADPSSSRLLFGALPPPAATAASAPGPAAVVFDLAHLSYIGAPTIDATLSDGTTSIPSMVTAGGRWYTAGRGGLFVGSTTSTPVGQGLRYPVYSSYTGVLLADPVSHRIFVQRYDSANGGLLPYFDVFQDSNQSLTGTPAEPPDSLTKQIDEKPGVTAAQFAGHSDAVGARFRVVGGTSGLIDGSTFGLLTLTGGILSSSTNGAVGGIPSTCSLPPDYSSRELDFGAVRAADLNNYEANAHADVAEADTSTQTQLTQATTPDCTTHTTGATWPFTEQNCSAPVVPQSSRQYGGDSSDQVNCSLGQSVAATSQSESVGVGMAILGASQASSSPPLVEVGQAGSKLSIQLDPKAGTLTTVESWATALLAGGAKIDSVRATVSCAAHGRTGTAACTYQKVIGAVYVNGARVSSGCVVEQSGSGAVNDTCKPLLDILNSLQPGLLVFNAPFPDTRADAYYGSHGGYQAVAQRELYEHLQDSILNYDESSEVPGLQILYVNDSPTAPSRLDVQLANVEAESHYGILPANSDIGGFGPAGIALPSLPITVPPPAVVHAISRSPLATIVQLIQHVIDGVKFLLRTPWQGLLAGLTLLLLSWPLVMAVSRRRLLEELS